MAVVTVAELVSELSLDIGDTELTEENLRAFIHKAVNRLNRRLELAGLETTLSVDADCNINFPNSALRDLIVLQAECLIAKRTQMEAVNKGIRIRSGTDEVDTTAGFGGLESVTKSVCEELDEAFQDYMENAASDAVVDGGKLIWYGTQRTIADLEHDGDEYEQRRYKSPMDSDHEGGEVLS
jgi:hypothetical protein